MTKSEIISSLKEQIDNGKYLFNFTLEGFDKQSIDVGYYVMEFTNKQYKVLITSKNNAVSDISDILIGDYCINIEEVK